MKELRTNPTRLSYAPRFVFASLAALCCLAASPSAVTAQTQTPQTSTPQPAAQQPTPQQPARQQPIVPQAPARDSQDEPVEFVNTDLVKLTVTVTDSYERFVTGIERNAFTITDNKVEQEILFFSDEDAPASVGVLFDFSGSMSGEKIARAREALRKFINTSHEQDEYFLVGFNSRANLILDRTRDSDRLLDKLTFVETKGNTALYDAVYLGVEKVSRGVHDKKVLLIISDGQDNNSRYTFKEVRRLLKESGVLIYSVGITSGGDMLDISGQAILEELSSVSGGKAFFPSTGPELNNIFETISLELRHQYSISYRPTPFTPDGKWRRVKVKVQPPRGLPRLFVRSKEGYFALTTPGR